jgi:endonuclease/exonuclease/phosphatase family metal-dependent hydrolase
VRSQKVWQAVNSMQEIETGSFTKPHFVVFPPDCIRIVSWNINRGLQLQRILEFLEAARADLVLLQECDLNARRTHHLNIAKEISQKLEMNYVFGREFQELTQGSRTSPAYHGQATFSRWPLSGARIIRFRRQSNFWRPHWFLPEISPFQERLGGRLALVVEASIAGKMMVTYNLHLESKGDDGIRCAQLGQTLDDAQRYDVKMPIVLAGDFNLDVSEGPGAAALSQAQFQDAFANHHVPTTPHSLLDKGRIIDWIFTRGPARSSEARVHRSVRASDHYPLSITMKFAER